MNSLPLTGRIEASGFPSAYRSLLRLSDPTRPPLIEADAALLRSPEDCRRAMWSGYQRAVAVTEHVEELVGFRAVARLGPGFDWLAPGDVMAVEPAAKRYRVLWRQASRHNAFLVTDRCDHRCLMCSQPPKDVDDGWIIDEIRECLALLPPETATVGFTGGEPFLDWRRFIPLVQATQVALPTASIHVLTNGRAFSRAEVVAAWSRLDRDRACVGIPIYSAVNAIHNYVVQSHHALDETVLGILRLKDKGNRVEVRVVLHRLTVARLVETSEWLARNSTIRRPRCSHGNGGYRICSGEPQHALDGPCRLWQRPIPRRFSAIRSSDEGVCLQPAVMRAARLGPALRGAVDLRLEERVSRSLCSVRRAGAVRGLLHDGKAEAEQRNRPDHFSE